MKIQMKYKDAVHCYGMSLQTTPDLFKNSLMQQEHMAYPEFLEMVVRMGDLYFHEEDEAKLSTKLKFILDDMLDIVDRPRVDYNPYMSDASSSSDYDD